MALRENVPREFSDDVRWYRYFTQKMIVAILIVSVAGLILCKILSLVGMEIVGIFITVIALAVAMFFLCVPVPKGDLMKGSGLLAGTVFIRIHTLKKRGKILYIKGYEEDEHATTDQ